MQSTSTGSRGMTLDVALLANDEVNRVTHGIVDVYRATFTVSPWDENEEDVQWFGERLVEHARRHRFRCAVARDSDSASLVGFAYGYEATPGEWWYDAARRALGQESEQRWLGDAFEFVELAVMPSARGNGIGGCLHDALLGGLTCKTAVLTTLDEHTAASRFYCNRGWITLVRGFVYSGSEKPCVLMGLDLEQSFGRGQST